jgi:hypothetical protein
MRVRTRRSLLAGVVLTTFSPVLQAGEFAVAAEAGWFDFGSARKSTKAVFEATGGATFGGSARYGITNAVFVGAAAHVFHKEGQRAFAADASSPAFRLGHPLSMRLLPVYGFVGYRFRFGRRLVPYVALGAGVTSYREESTVAGEVQPAVTASKVSWHALGGLELGRGMLRVGAEIQYHAVPKALGLAGISRVYGEDDAGGFTAVGKIVFATR